MKDFWNDKFETEEYIYGKKPNNYLIEKLKHLKPGKILFAAEGEGRNAVFAAKQNWQVEAFDLSENAKNKALKFAQENNVEINYKLQEFLEIPYQEQSFDAVALIYAHFEKDKKQAYFKQLDKLLKKMAI
ncbi:SAM-dependent methyltransferase [Mesonia aquimarina]|uniref:SAM-dependent methyltransferase n=1 Tax=Mesonia aquimarina TaxID=1504967 RepID=UPI0029372A35|nr:methyltransferase domain-containing protein [Mesonia aquimarina]